MNANQTTVTTKVAGKRKSEMFKILSVFSEETVRKEMIETIMISRNVPEKEAKDTKTLFPSEVEAVLKKFA